ncbi:hypothetical protein H0H92_014754 [Tricholoma furcatifolium]|nr:hypothetical protein H0H92_014754 [Tricholoma furcatifolium]
MFEVYSTGSGLCVYEIDDPALRLASGLDGQTMFANPWIRDDPSLDENTRLKNRIAELESLVRELRGKPHPRWADSSFRDGDPNEKWHSRATKCSSMTKRRGSSPDRPNGRVIPPALSPIKTEPVNDTSSNLYRFSASPAPPSVRYHNNFQTDVRSSSYDNDHTYTSTNGNYHPSDSPTAYHGQQHNPSVPSSYSENGSYTLSGSDDGNSYHSSQGDQYTTSHICSCRTSPGTSIAYISLAQQLQTSLSSLRQYSPHPSNTTCILYRRIVELNNIMHGTNSQEARASYDTPPEREIMTPLSASSGHASFHTGSSSGQVSPQEWSTLATSAGYNPYFPPQPEHGMYTHVAV